MGYVKVVGHKDPTVFTAEVILEREDGENGEPTVVARKGYPVELSAEHQKTLEDMGFVVESSSKEEAEAVARGTTTTAADDTASAGPSLGNTSSNPAPGVSEANAQSTEETGGSKSGSGSKKN